MTSWIALLLGILALPTAFAANAETVAATVDALSRDVPAIVVVEKTAGLAISAETAASVYADAAFGRKGPSARQAAAVRANFGRLRAAGAEFRVAADGSLRIDGGDTAYEVVFEREL